MVARNGQRATVVAETAVVAVVETVVVVVVEEAAVVAEEEAAMAEVEEAAAGFQRAPSCPTTSFASAHS